MTQSRSNTDSTLISSPQYMHLRLSPRRRLHFALWQAPKEFNATLVEFLTATP